MPNNPLVTFRAVEPSNPGFTAAVGLTSAPFVLQHYRSFAAATASAQTTVAPTPITLAATRFMPWLNRMSNNVYPVAVPNAYDRVYIFPMLCLDTTPSADLTPVPTTGAINSLATYAPPAIIPFGLLPETRGAGTGGKLLKSRLPDDLITAAAPSATPQFSTRTDGLWMPLMPYASNFTTNNAQITAALSNYSSSVPRNLVTNAGIGNGYMLPLDASISLSTTSSITSATPGLAAYTTASTVGPVISAGLEFTLSGCQELVVSLANIPTLPQYTIDANAGATLTGAGMGFNFFLMGMFLG